MMYKSAKQPPLQEPSLLDRYRNFSSFLSDDPALQEPLAVLQADIVGDLPKNSHRISGTFVKQAMELFRDIYSLCRTPESFKALYKIQGEFLYRIESLPIAWDNIKTRGIAYFVLQDGVWWPVHAGDINKLYHSGPVLNGSTKYEDGSIDSGPTLWGGWATCTADDTPCLPFETWQEYFDPSQLDI